MAKKPDKTPKKTRKKAPSRGGFRAGSGRKTIYENPVTRSFVMPQALIDRLGEVAIERETSINALVVELLTKSVQS